MKNFLRRLKFYGAGFGIGIVFVFFFFQNRGCTWLPSNRVKNTILGRVIVIHEDQQALLSANNISKEEVVQFLNDGEVRFGKSKKTGNPQVYSFTKEINGVEKELWFTIPKNGYISEVQWPKGSIQRAGNSKKGVGKMIAFPNVKNIVYLDDNKLFSCQLEKTGLTKSTAVMKRLKLSGQVDFEKSALTAKDDLEKPVQYIFFTSPSGREIGASTIWNEEHIRFTYFDVKDSLNCTAN